MGRENLIAGFDKAKMTVERENRGKNTKGVASPAVGQERASRPELKEPPGEITDAIHTSRT